MNSHYYDEPEGQDAFGKICAINKFAGAAGLAWATVDVIALSKPKGYLPTLARFTIVAAPFVGAASAFALGTIAATNIRDKDDRLNYAFGGYCAGAVLGVVKRSFYVGGMLGTIFAAAAVAKKVSRQEGWSFFPDPDYLRAYGSLTGATHDYTLFAERPKNYTTNSD